MSLETHVRTLGRGPGRSRSLTFDEAVDAMGLMLSGAAAAEAIGALLMLLRMKGETAEEIAGFAHAARQATPVLPKVDLDWPSYAAGRTRGDALFLLSAKLVAAAGHSVLIHGWNGPDAAIRDGLNALGIAFARPAEVDGPLAQDGLAYLPLEDMIPGLFGLLRLREVLGLRSCINTVCRMLNPAGARTSVQGVFHPSYRLLQADAAKRLGWDNLSVIKGGGGEFECHPAKDILAFGLRNGVPWEETFPKHRDDTRHLKGASADPARLVALWTGHYDDPFAIEVVISTAALALHGLGYETPRAVATQLWTARACKTAA